CLIQLPRGRSASAGRLRPDRSRPLRRTFSDNCISPPCCEKPCRCTTTSTAAAARGISFQRRNRSGSVPACERNAGVSARKPSPGMTVSLATATERLVTSYFIAARDCFASLPMTAKNSCHCEERSDEAISLERAEERAGRHDRLPDL